MTPEQEVFSGAVEATARVARRLHNSVKALGPGPLESATFAGADDRQQLEIDAFIKRFEQFADSVARRVFRACLVAAGREVRRMTFRDALNDLAALELIADVEFWMQISSIRNRLAHSYPLDPEKQVAALNPALAAAAPMIEAFDEFVRRARTRALLQ